MSEEQPLWRFLGIDQLGWAVIVLAIGAAVVGVLLAFVGH